SFLYLYTKLVQMKCMGLLMMLGVVLLSCESGNSQTTAAFDVHKTEAEWRAELTPEQYHILREGGTEARFSSPVLNINGSGYLLCAACGNRLFKLSNKFKSECGWPSFDRALEGAVVYRADYKLWHVRTEVLCAKCGSHLGHVFNDGPQETTGKRYCINGVALRFVENNKDN